MTSAPDSEPHPEVAEISDLTEGLLAPDRATEVRLHLANCPLCADVLASLAEIGDLLGDLPEPERMPSDVAARIDAALASEAATGGSSRADVPQRDVPRGTSPSGPGSVPRGTSAAPPSHPSAGTGPGRPDRFGPRRRRVTLLAAGWTVGALALGGILYGVASAGGGSSSGEDATASSAKRAVAGPVAGSVADQVRQLLAEPQAPVHPGSGPTEGPDHGNTPMLNGTGTGTAPAPSRSQGQGQDQGHGVTDTPSCVLKATHRSQVPLAVGRDRFQGTDSYLVVLPHPADRSLVDAFVVNASCSAANPGTVLFQGTYPRR